MKTGNRIQHLLPVFCLLNYSILLQTNEKLNKMKQGKARFDYQLNKVNALLSEAQSQENPALWLFLHDLRTPMFMLESLSKMYSQFHDKAFFTEINVRFKEIEDVLGAIDYYAAFLREFHADVKIPMTVKNHLESKTREKIILFNDLLIKKGWTNGKNLRKINEGLTNSKWQNQEDEIANIEKYYHKQIKKINEFVSETTFEFKNVETQVHELRRKLRWLSIYPQAFQGAIQLHENEADLKNLKKYLIEEIVSSPFNNLPVSSTIKHHLLLEKCHFLALSWMISELGKLKDKGLKITALKNAFQEIAFLKDEEAMNEAYRVLGNDYPKMDILLKQAGVVAQKFFDEKVIDKLIWGID